MAASGEQFSQLAQALFPDAILVICGNANELMGLEGHCGLPADSCG
jgi:hypothetical protein